MAQNHTLGAGRDTDGSLANLKSEDVGYHSVACGLFEVYRYKVRFIFIL